MGEPSNGNGELTRDILRTELKAARYQDKLELMKELDRRFEPVNDHIQRVDRGELTPAAKAAIVEVIRDDNTAKVGRRAMKAPLFAVSIAALSLISTLGVTIGRLVFGG